MAEKSILFMARTTRFHEFAQSLTASLGVEVNLATPDSPTAAHEFDLLLLDADGVRNDRIEQIAKWLDDRGNIPMLVIVDEETLPTLSLPAHARCDFVCSSASTVELEVRSRRLLGEDDPFAVNDILHVDNMVINLATYQVYLDDEPVDLTSWSIRCSPSWRPIPTVRTAARCCCTGCGASSTAAARAPSTCTSGASAPRWVRRSRRTSPRCAAWAIFSRIDRRILKER